MTEKLYSATEAAKKLGISYQLLVYYRKTGKLKSVLVGNSYVITQKAFDEFKKRFDK
jgi:excisionase family DNA binding protein